MSQNKPKTKSDAIRLLVQHGWSDTRKIAGAVRCSIALVNHVRGEMRALQAGAPRLATVERNQQRLNQDVRDLRKFVLHIAGIVRQITTHINNGSRPKMRIVSRLGVST